MPCYEPTKSIGSAIVISVFCCWQAVSAKKANSINKVVTFFSMAIEFRFRIEQLYLFLGKIDKWLELNDTTE
jgi:hypothetical protein